VLRASAVAERAGVPTASLVCEGFLGQAATTSTGLGLPGLPTALVPGHVDVQSPEELRRNVAAVTVDAVIRNLTEAPPRAGGGVVEPAPGDVVLEGLAFAADRFTQTGAARILGAAMAGHVRSSAPSLVEARPTSGPALAWSCEAGRTGGGVIQQRWLVKPGTYREAAG